MPQGGKISCCKGYSRWWLESINILFYVRSCAQLLWGLQKFSNLEFQFVYLIFQGMIYNSHANNSGSNYIALDQFVQKVKHTSHKHTYLWWRLKLPENLAICWNMYKSPRITRRHSCCRLVEFWSPAILSNVRTYLIALLSLSGDQVRTCNELPTLIE